MKTIALLLARSTSIFLAVLGAALPGGNAQSSMTIVATGSSLPEPLYIAWGDEYHKQHPETQFRYIAKLRLRMLFVIFISPGDIQRLRKTGARGHNGHGRLRVSAGKCGPKHGKKDRRTPC